MWILNLNDMRSSNIETQTTVARADTMEDLQDFLKSQETEPYIEGRWQKFFKKGSLLEWFNKPFKGEPTFIILRTKEDFLQECEREFDDAMEENMRLPNVSEMEFK